MLKTFSQYAIVFDNRSKYYVEDKERNLFYIRTVERFCNYLLISRTSLHLSYVYGELGLPITEESCNVGWIFEEGNEIGDNFVEFDIYEDGENIIIDFNVDGDITDRL